MASLVPSQPHASNLQPPAGDEDAGLAEGDFPHANTTTPRRKLQHTVSSGKRRGHGMEIFASVSRDAAALRASVENR